MTPLLVLDMASDQLGVALVAEGTEPTVIVRGGATAHSRLLLPMVAEAISVAGRRPTAVAVVTGPGSYAGIRVGIATASGLALGWNVALFGVPTLAAVATASGRSDRFAAVHPAGRGEWAVQEFEGESPCGPLRPAVRAELPPLPLVGEGAGALGGLEVGVRERLLATAERVRRGLAGGADAIYLREPHVTLARARWRREGSREPTT